MNILHTKKFRYGSVSMALTIVIIAAVILINAIVTALVGKFGLYLDMTPEKMFTLSDEAIAYLDGMDTSKKVEIIFCSPEDIMEANTAQLDVLETVRDIEKKYDNVTRKHVDYLTNPTALSKYGIRGDITSSSIIVASGVEYRVFSLSALFSYDSTGSSVVGYNGEQRLVSAILSVTQDEKPLVCVTTGHGEVEEIAKTGLQDFLENDMGYEYQTINLRTQEIPERCRMIVIFNPDSDFLEKNPAIGQDISELAKLDTFLDDDNALMVFVDRTTQVAKLPNLTDFLAEWGIGICHLDASEDVNQSSYLIKDPVNSFTTDGTTCAAEFVTSGLGASMTSQLWKDIAYPKSVVFPHSTALYSTYEQIGDEEGEGDSGYYHPNGLDRSSYAVLTSSAKAIAEANGSAVSSAKGPFNYMMLTQNSRIEGDEQINSHVLVCSSTEFVSKAALETGYGNHSVLAYACYVMNRDVVPVTLDCKYYADLEINAITAQEANQYTIVLTVIPASIIFISGIYIMVRRKYR